MEPDDNANEFLQNRFREIQNTLLLDCTSPRNFAKRKIERSIESVSIMIEIWKTKNGCNERKHPRCEFYNCHAYGKKLGFRKGTEVWVIRMEILKERRVHCLCLNRR